MHPENDDDRAVRAACGGDRQAFAMLVERYQAVAFRTAFLITHDPAAAEDVAQEAFIRAYGALDRFRAGEPFRPWLLRIVTNAALNAVRSRGRRQGVIARFSRLRPEDPPQPALLAEESEGQRLLWRAMRELSEEDRVVLYLRWFLDLPEREIAAAIGKPPGTVKSRLHRAGARLRAVIEEQYPSLRPAGGDHA
ncbi:MAG: RNA polymerase sigma factor [Dehalococcoidia bacterium]